MNTSSKYIVFLLLLSGTSFGQRLTKQNFEGTWECSLNERKYLQADTIIFYEGNFNSPNCYTTSWNINSKNRFRVENRFNCTEPGRICTHGRTQKFKIRNGKIKFWVDGLLIEAFQILNYTEKRIEKYPFDVRELKVKRLSSNMNWERCWKKDSE